MTWIFVLVSIISMLAGLVAGVAIGFNIFHYYQHNLKNSEPVDQLKNALLTLALISIKQKDIDNNSTVNYASPDWDGDKLPSLSGCSLENICFSYLTSRGDLRNGFYSKHMENKLVAIEKYLSKHLNTPKQVNDFFNSFYNKIQLDDQEDQELKKDN